MTISSIGYGDITPTPHQPREHLVAICLMLVGGFVWSQIVATFCGVLATMNPAQRIFRLNMAAVNGYMEKNQLPAEMCQRVRDYFHRSKHLWTTENNQAVLLKMSPALQSEVLRFANNRWVDKVTWLRDEDPLFVTTVVLALKPAIFAPREEIKETALHIINSGIAIYGGRILRTAGVWGQDMLIAAPHLRTRISARAVTYLEVFFIHRDALLKLAMGFSDTWPRLQRKTRYLALQRYIVLVARSKSLLTPLLLKKPPKLTVPAETNGRDENGKLVPRKMWRCTLTKHKALISFRRRLEGESGDSCDKVQADKAHRLSTALFRSCLSERQHSGSPAGAPASIDAQLQASAQAARMVSSGLPHAGHAAARVVSPAALEHSPARPYYQKRRGGAGAGVICCASNAAVSQAKLRDASPERDFDEPLMIPEHALRCNKSRPEGRRRLAGGSESRFEARMAQRMDVLHSAVDSLRREFAEFRREMLPSAHPPASSPQWLPQPPQLGRVAALSAEAQVDDSMSA